MERTATVVRDGKETPVEFDSTKEFYDPARKEVREIARPTRVLLAEMRSEIASLAARIKVLEGRK